MTTRTRFTFWSRFVAVGLPIFRSELRRRALTATVLLTTLLLTISALNVGNSYVTRDLMTALSRREEHRFYGMAGALLGVFVASTGVAVFARYVEERLGLMWREWLTRRFLDRYLRGRTYRGLIGREDVDNPDQRITEDVKTFSLSTLSLTILAFNAVLAIVTFAGVLWSITPWLLVAAFGYAVLGSLGMVSVGRNLPELNNAQFRKEADFRYALIRLREHAGAVAQLAGEPDEKQRLGQKLRELLLNLRCIIDLNRNLGFFSNGYNYLTQLIPVVIVAPMYIHGRVELGIVMQAVMAFAFTLNGFSLIVTQFQQLSSYSAVVMRLGTLWEAIQDERRVSSSPLSPQTKLVAESEPGGRRVIYDEVTLETPQEGKTLVRGLSLEVPAGQRLLVTGPNSAGKTALFLATAGLWERGHGHIVRPEAPDTMFLSQQPYAVAGPLRDHLLYGLDRRQITDARVSEVLRLVGLEDVLARLGGLEADHDWANLLSEGALQACAVARVILAKPRFAFLDQALAMVESSQEEKLYDALSHTDITYVSIGDRPALFPFHQLRLDLHDEGAWTILPM